MASVLGGCLSVALAVMEAFSGCDADCGTWSLLPSVAPTDNHAQLEDPLFA